MLTVMAGRDVTLSKKKIERLCKKILRVLSAQKIRNKKLLKKELSLVFVKPAQMKKINFQFRRKQYVTDVLSFEGPSGQELGELVFCWAKIESQASEHGLSPEQELTYLMLHGVLHLLGYDHEGSRHEARIMLDLQDRIFAQLCPSPV